MRRIHQICEIVTLAECYAHARQVALSTLSHRASGSSTWLDRCATGHVTVRSAIAFVQWLSNNWPPGLEWPEGIDRPDPERGSPARTPFAVSGDTAALPADAASPRLRATANQGSGTQASHPGRDEIVAAALRLGPSGQIASPGALRRALGFKRSVYYSVVRRYRDGVGAGRWPRAGSDSERMLIALSAAEDVRFASRRVREAA